MEQPYLINSISEQHRLLGLPKPKHPLISVFRHENTGYDDLISLRHFTLNFYCISIKKDYDGKLKYGQRHYDFDEGMMAFISPNQLLMKLDAGSKPPGGMTLMFHPDFIANTSLAARIRNFHFFSYELNEALHLSESEEAVIEGLFDNIEREYQTGIDSFSRDVMIAQIELLLQYSSRFYARQFITRKVANDEILIRLENLLDEHFSEPKGLLLVQQIAGELNLSADYLSDMLRTITGQTAQQHIHAKLIEKAKELLTTTNLQVSEIAYQLGFEHPQSFNKLFKSKTNMSPVAFRTSFN
ncbi:helix-turn-helix transcriptional regulator [Mucilaginibacter sp. 21P]|uniref:helix-turn-helix domain-containing protein n=1 Tax=Mucilaginibacter sp. 21P TaxID=2778902 RepID=UPI001C591163|nr:helix-turn-helix transcriptional regulator [Mucilaginibacter sp. 21P]QXV64036.1 helix-turn-helix transcriptional regulator [Mucilaginibacter sp. 21P]